MKHYDSWDGFVSGDDAAESTCGLFGGLLYGLYLFFYLIPKAIFWRSRD